MKRVLHILVFLFFFCSFLLHPRNAFAVNVKINEVLVHPSNGNKEWVEFYNPDKIDLSSYYIDDDTSFNDDTGNSTKKQLSDITNTATQFPYIELTSSIFNNSGDSVVLFASDGTVVDQYTYPDDPGEDITIGRSPDGTGDFNKLASETKGSANSAVLPPTNTPTLTPSDTPKPPTSTPTPKQNTPTPTKSPTATSVPTTKPTPSVSPLPFAGTTSAVLGDETSQNENSTEVPLPTISLTKEGVLAAETKDSSFLTAFLWIVGAGILCLCGILAYFRMKKKDI